MEDLKNLPLCMVPEDEFKRRKTIQGRISEELAKSVRYEIEIGYSYVGNIRGLVPKVILESDPRWKDKLSGAVGTVEESACIALVAWQILKYYGIEVSVLELKDLIVEKGYRAWKPIGIGGMHVLLDNIIAMYRGVKPIEDTRLRTVSDVYRELGAGHFVPVLVKNSVYWDDESRKGNHFVLFAAVKNNEAIVIDSSIGERRLPIFQLLRATIVAWEIGTRKE